MGVYTCVMLGGFLSPKVEGQAVGSAGMLVLQVGRIAPQRINAFMINGFPDVQKMF